MYNENIPKVLLVDTNLASLPIYNFLLKKGLEVYVIGSNPNDTLAKNNKNYIQADYSDIGKLLDIITKFGFKFIVPGCNDLSYLVCTQINEKTGLYYGIESTQTTNVLNVKNEFRNLLINLNLPSPKVYESSLKDVVYPIIVKPVDSFSGKGNSIVHHEKDIENAISNAKKHSSSSTFILEEYIEGQLYSHSGFIQDGEILIDFIVEEHGSANPFVVDTSKVIYDFENYLYTKIKDYISKIISKLTLKNGLIHTQFIVRNDEVYCIEITKRCPGDLYSMLILLSTGFPYAEHYVMPFLDQKYKKPIGFRKEEKIIRHTISSPLETKYYSLNFRMPFTTKKYFSISTSGDLIKKSPFSRIGLLFIEAQNNEEQDLIFESLLKRNFYLIENE